MREARPAGRWTHGWNEGTSEWRGPRGFVSSVGGESSREVLLFNKLSAQHHGGRQLHKYPCVFPFVWAAALCVFLQIWFFRLSFFHCNCLLHPLSHVLCLLVCCRFSQSVYFTVLFLPRLSDIFFPHCFAGFSPCTTVVVCLGAVHFWITAAAAAFWLRPVPSALAAVFNKRLFWFMHSDFTLLYVH